MAGTTDPEVLADLAKTRLRTKLPELRKALDCRFREHHGFLVSQILAHVDYLEEAIGVVSARLDEALVPFQPAITVLVSIPGVQRRTAEVVIAEIGTDMSRFPTSRHLASWAGLCPGITRAPGNANTDARPRAARGYGPRWSKQRSERPVRPATCARSTGGSEADEDTSEP